jgi:hypothetical protein
MSCGEGGGNVELRGAYPRVLAGAMHGGLKDGDQLRPRILFAVPCRAQPPHRFCEVGPMIQVGQPTFEIAICEMPFDIGWLKLPEMACKFARVVGSQREPADRPAGRRPSDAGMEDAILHELRLSFNISRTS